MADQYVGIVAVLRVQALADTARQLQLATLVIEGGHDRGDDGARHGIDLTTPLDIWCQHQEFVAAEARRAGHALQRKCVLRHAVEAVDRTHHLLELLE